MVNLLSIVLAGAAVLMPRHEDQAVQRMTLGARVYFPGGKAAGTLQQRFVLGSGTTTWYVFTGKTLCEAQTVSAEKPSFAGNGWRVDLKPGAAGTLQATWERLWAGGKSTTGGGTRSMTIGSGTPLVLDSIDGGARLQRQEMMDRLKNVSTNDLRALSSLEDIAGISNSRTEAIRTRLTQLEGLRRQLTNIQRLGAANSQVTHIDAETADNRKALQEVLTANVASVLTMLQTNTQLAAVDGCDALSMNLQITAEASSASDPTETEIWLVHKDPAGLETMQRQVVRSASGNGSYVFDDIVVKTERGPITVEVYGSIGVRTGADPWLGLDVNRRYVTTATAFNWKTKEGGTKFNQAFRPDEVLAFNLLPMKDDEGALVGHRFSVRVRTKILK